MNSQTRTFATAIFLFASGFLSAQKPKDQIEINPIIRYDTYPEVTYNWGGRVSTNYLKMKGTSWGIYANYKKSFAPSFYLKAGIGYYKYSFDKLNNRHPPFGEGEAREVDIGSTAFILYTTDRYWY